MIIESQDIRRCEVGQQGLRHQAVRHGGGAGAAKMSRRFYHVHTTVSHSMYNLI